MNQLGKLSPGNPQRTSKTKRQSPRIQAPNREGQHRRKTRAGHQHPHRNPEKTQKAGVVPAREQHRR